MTKTARTVIITAAMAGMLTGTVALTTGCHTDRGHGSHDGTMNRHDCKGANACKGLGGCKTATHACKGQNSCKGQGGCKS
ncbi:MAG: hypothetical protein ABIP71_10600 [Verrucomicrobiota bacterium]